jgi:hypothetical protein
MPRSAGETAPYIPTAHCTLAPYASAGVALRSNADESRGLYGAFGKSIGNCPREKKLFLAVSENPTHVRSDRLCFKNFLADKVQAFFH